MNTKLWIALSLAVAFIIGALLMLYLNPTGLLFSAISFIAGGIMGYLLKGGILQKRFKK